ncbi:CLUMA_CG010216, isoform A [Clunio marinus]|uniref:CLUMA_CG010216, isoform A n=1 Tax=Clunio marinus TaxID=568069 RepID=A0A1J1IDH9_9DIPT|nr:CLUMA_CG010216, isoform A [Clunio marinus]
MLFDDVFLCTLIAIPDEKNIKIVGHCEMWGIFSSTSNSTQKGDDEQEESSIPSTVDIPTLLSHEKRNSTMNYQFENIVALNSTCFNFISRWANVPFNSID